MAAERCRTKQTCGGSQSGKRGRKGTKRIEKRGCAGGLRENRKAQQKFVEMREVYLRG